MTTKLASIRSEPHWTVGETIQREAVGILARWTTRAKSEQPSAKRAHHDVLIDHLPIFLWELGRSLAAPAEDQERNVRTAEVHGDQRWEAGWSISDVVVDYQLLRVVIIEHLEECLERPLTSKEFLAISVSIDDAIAASVESYSTLQEGNAKADPIPERSIDSDGLFNILGFLGHEIRNPLAPLGNAIQILRMSNDNPAQVEKVRLLMERQFRVMTRMVEDLMDAPRLVRGKLSLKRERVDLTAIVKECVEDRRGALSDAGLKLELNLPEEPLWTSGDPTRLCQAFVNVVNNAQKFTDRGGRISVTLQSDDNDHVARLNIRDSGIGIDKTFLPKVFETFMQADRSLDRSRGGLGLGLALVKGIIDLHGGSVSAASDGVGHGAEFAIELPLLDVPAASGLDTPLAEANVTPRRVLIIEDNRDSAESLRQYLEIFNHVVMTASSGADGIALARNFRPDVVVSDIGLPGMSGYAVCKELRADPSFTSTLLVALSGHGSDGSKESSTDAGFDVFFVKPVDPEELAQLIARHGNSRPAI